MVVAVLVKSGGSARAVATDGQQPAEVAGSRRGEAEASAAGATAACIRAAAAAAATAEVVVGLFPRPSLSIHLRGSLLLSFFK